MRIVRDNTEPRISSILLHNPPQRHLCRIRHRIRLIQHNKLVPRRSALRRRSSNTKDLLGRRKRLDLLAHDVDAAVVGGVELEDHLPHVLRAVDVARQREDCRSLSSTGGPVEEEVGEAVCRDEFVEGREDVLVARDVGEGRGAVLFYPRKCQRAAEGAGRWNYWV